MAVGVDRRPNTCSTNERSGNIRTEQNICSVVHDSIARYIKRETIALELYRAKVIEMELYRKSYKNPRERNCEENVMHKIVGVEMVRVG